MTFDVYEGITVDRVGLWAWAAYYRYQPGGYVDGDPEDAPVLGEMMRWGPYWGRTRRQAHRRAWRAAHARGLVGM